MWRSEDSCPGLRECSDLRMVFQFSEHQSRIRGIFSQCTMWCWPTSKQNSLVEIPDGLSIWGPCVRYGVSFFLGGAIFCNLATTDSLFELDFSTLHQIGGMSQIWGSSAIYLPWRRDHATWWCGDRWLFSWNRCFLNYTPQSTIGFPRKWRFGKVFCTHNTTMVQCSDCWVCMFIIYV